MISVYNVSSVPPEQIGPSLEDTEANQKIAELALIINKDDNNLLCWIVYKNKL